MERRESIRGIERAVVQLARSLGRRHLGRHIERKLGKIVGLSSLAVVDAVEECAESGTFATVGLIARRIGVDPSRASRMVTAALRAGYVRRVASQDDGRKSCLMLTAKGSDAATAVRGLRTRFFLARLQVWPDADCQDLCRLLTKLAHDMGTRKRPDDSAEMGVFEEDGGEEGAIVLLHPAATQAPARTRRRTKTG
ncbi:MAG TPA: MarR family winged helix-turn-helix transcriptional regulator [Rhizomicrobium sp.]